MSVPVSQMWAVASWVLKQRVLRRKHYATVLMLEPLLKCNLACAGCGKIQYPPHVLRREMEVEDAMAAVKECGAPIVSIPGGEPLMYSRIGELVEALVAKRKYIYLCTNAILMTKRIEEGVFKPSKYLNFSVHLDGDVQAHDFAVCREGIYTKAEEAVRFAIERGFRVTTNTTLFENIDVPRMRAFFDRATELGVEGMTISPGYSYQKAPDQENFLSRERTFKLFRDLLEKPNPKWKFNQSPLFMEFLMGKRHLECTPWGNPCYTLFGWQRPCYLLQEGYAATFKELIQTTEWDNYGRASGNPKCANCMVHCGHEPTAVHQTFNSLEGFVATTKATFRGVPDSGIGKDITPPAITNSVQTGAEREGLTGLDLELQQAVDFRGDVTLTLRGGREIVGYLFNASETQVDYYPPGGEAAMTVPRSDVAAVEQSGRDCANGKSWETWARKYEEKKAAEARGEQVEPIGLYPESL